MGNWDPSLHSSQWVTWTVVDEELTVLDYCFEVRWACPLFFPAAGLNHCSSCCFSLAHLGYLDYVLKLQANCQIMVTPQSNYEGLLLHDGAQSLISLYGMANFGGFRVLELEQYLSLVWYLLDIYFCYFFLILRVWITHPNKLQSHPSFSQRMLLDVIHSYSSCIIEMWFKFWINSWFGDAWNTEINFWNCAL